AFGCSCSRQRVGDVLLALGAEQAMESIEASTGVVGVQCEFCGQRYSFDPVDLEQLFAGGGTERASSRKLN
ncbi:MAG: Hsp33 family molecular chaperone HslO, partial [Xanthomonadales bacterium]|nr:Hsp33 family molecular chaperone HslO [Xanthomonadales bacterium]